MLHIIDYFNFPMQQHFRLFLLLLWICPFEVYFLSIMPWTLCFPQGLSDLAFENLQHNEKKIQPSLA
jgi:hypothetical protein